MTTAVSLSPLPILQFFDNRGQPNAGGTLLTQVGSVNHATWQDSSGSTPLPNPIPLNSRGEVSNAAGTSCQLFLEDGVTYAFTLYDSAGNQLNQASSIAGLNAGSLSLAADLANTTDVTKGDAMIGVKLAGTGAIARTQHDVNAEQPVSVLAMGMIADADPATYASASSAGAANAAALQQAIDTAWTMINNPTAFAAGQYGACVFIPPGYYEIAGPNPVIVRPGVKLMGCGMYVTALCVRATFAPTKNLNGSGAVQMGVLLLDSADSPYSAVAGFPTTVCDMSILGLNPASAHGVFVNKNGCVLERLWIAGFSGATGTGIVLNNTDNIVDKFVVEQCTYGVIETQINFGNQITNGIANVCGYGFTFNNNTSDKTDNPLTCVAGGTSGATPTIKFSSGQHLATAANAFVGYRVTITGGAGYGPPGQTGLVTASSNAAGVITMTIAPTGGNWATAPDATTTAIIIGGTSTTKVSNCIAETCSQIGFYALNARGLQLSNCGVAQSGTSSFAQGALVITASTRVAVSNFVTDSAQDYRVANNGVDGISISDSEVSLDGCTAAGWRTGVVVSGLSTVSISNLTACDNYYRGLAISDNVIAAVTGGLYVNNGSAGTPGFGIWIANQEAAAQVVVTGATVDGLYKGAASYQTTGIYANASTSTSWITLTGNSSKNHATANYTFAGSIGAIFTDPTVPRDVTVVASATTTTLPLSYCQGGFVDISGTTTITSITAAPSGYWVALKFQGALTLTDGSNLKLAGDYITTANDTITLRSDGVNWWEMGRSGNI